jgi:hypothetical protein
MGSDPIREARLRQICKHLIAASDPKELELLRRELYVFLTGNSPEEASE